jgi:hypothetical protein
MTTKKKINPEEADYFVRWLLLRLPQSTDPNFYEFAGAFLRDLIQEHSVSWLRRRGLRWMTSEVQAQYSRWCLVAAAESNLQERVN